MKVDWDAGHGPVTGPLNVAGGALAATWAGHTAHMPPLWAAGIAGAGLLGHHLAGVRHRISGTSLAMRAATWTGAGAWCSYALATSPWTASSLGALAAGTIGLGAVWSGDLRAGRKEAAKQAAQQADEQRTQTAKAISALAAEWANRITRVCGIPAVTVIGIEQWDTGSGFTLDIEPAAGGTTWRQLKHFEDRLAADAKLPEGCGVEIKAGANRGAVLVNVATVNKLIDDAPYPDDFTPTSINDLSAIGVFKDGSLAGAVMRQLTSLTVGQKGSGKTNLMNVKIVNQLRMVDNLIWVLDLNGGGLALAWLHAWNKAGRPGRPPIDWVADTPEKALAMAKAMLRIAKGRKPGYKALEIAANDDKLPVSAKVPAITLNCDEIAELYSPKARQDPILKETGNILVQVVELARAVACNIDQAALRATQDVISEPQILKQSALKIGMAVDTESELNYLFGWRDRLSPEDAPYAGCGFIKNGSAPARPFKAYRITPDLIAKAVTATTAIRPELDALSLKYAGDDYKQRWDNTEHLFFSDPDMIAELLDTAPAIPTADTTAAEPTRPARRNVTADWDTTEPTGDTQAVIAAAEQVRNRVRDAANAATSRDDDLDQQFRQILNEGGALWKPPTDTQPPTPTTQQTASGPQPTPGISEDARWPLVFTLVVNAGPAGISPDNVREAFKTTHPDAQPPHRSAITDWLKNEPQVHKPAHGLYAYRPATPTGETP